MADVTSSEVEYAEAPNLTLQQPQQGVKLRVSSNPLSPELLPASANLLCISNVFGWLAVAVSQDDSHGFSLARLDAVRSTFANADKQSQASLAPERKVSTAARVLFLQFAMADKVILALLENQQLAVYRLKSMVDGSQLSPLHIFPLNSQVVDLLPNPADKPELVALLTANGQITLLNLDAQAETGTFGQSLTSACWSVKGKQIVCGTSAGQLVQITPEGQEKSSIAAPPALDSPHSVVDVRWLENDVFLVTYAPSSPQSGISNTVTFAINRTKTSLECIKFLDDPAAAMGDFEERPPRRFTVALKNWPPFKHLLFTANSASTDLAVLASSPAWAPLELEDKDRPSLPSSDDYAGTCPFGVAIDLTAKDGIQVTETSPLPPAPILYAYSSDGVLIAWMVQNSTEPFSAYQTPRDVLTQEDASSSDTQASVQPTSLPNPFAATSAPTSSSTKSAFGTTSIPSIGGSGFGSSGFGSSTFGSSTTSAFGAPAFGSKPTFGTSAAFGSSATSTPSTAAPSAFAGFSSSKPAAFGSSTPSSTATKPAFGASSFGSSSFGAKPSPPAAAPVSAFGGFAAKSGSPSTFGSSTTASAFGTSTGSGFGAFGSSSTPTKSFSGSAFTSTGRGESGVDEDEDEKPEKKGAPGLDDADVDELEPEAKGDASSTLGFAGFGLGSQPQTSAPSAFGAKTAAPPTSTFGAPLTFGASTFGAAKPQTSATPSTFGNNVKFGAFSKPSTTSAPSGFSFGASNTTTSAPAPAFGFGQASKPASTGFGFGSSTPSPFGTAQAEAKPASGFSFKAAQNGPAATPEAEKKPSQPASASTAPAFSFAQPASNPQPSTSSPCTSGISAAATSSSITAAPTSSTPTFSNLAQTSVTQATESGTAPKPPTFSFARPATVPAVKTPEEPSGSKPEAKSIDKPKTPEVPPSSSPFAGFGSKMNFGAVGDQSPGGTTTPKTLPLKSPFGESFQFGQKWQAKQSDDTEKQSEKKEPSDKSEQKTPEQSTSQPVKTQDGGSTAKSLMGFSSSPPLRSSPKSQKSVEEHPQGGSSEASQPQDQTAETSSEGEEELEQASENGKEPEELFGEELEDENGEEQEELFEEELEESWDEQEEEGDETVALENESSGDDEDEQSASKTPEDEPSTPPSPEKSSTVFSSTQSQPIAPAFSFANAPASTSTKSPFSFATDQKPATSTASPSSPFAAFKPSTSSPFASGFSLQASKPEAPKASPSPFGSGFSLSASKAEDAKQHPTPQSVASAPVSQSQPAFGKSPFSFANPAFGPSAAKLANNGPSPAQPASSVKSLADKSDQPPPPETSSSVATPASTAQAKASPFGFQAPSMPAQPVPGPSSSLQKPSTEQKPATSTSTSSKEQKPSNPLSNASVPRMEPPAAKTEPSEEGIAGEFLKVYKIMESELKMLHQNTQICTDYISRFKRPLQPTDAFPVSLEESEWSFGDLPQLGKLAKAVQEDISRITDAGQKRERRSIELRDLLLKCDLKREESARYIRARSDPEFRKLLKVRQLGPEQVENQKVLRQNSQHVYETIAKVEEQVAVLKAKLEEKKSGKQAMKTPALESINRTITNISSSLQKRNSDLDQIILDLEMIKLRSGGTPSKSPAKARGRTTNESSPASTSKFAETSNGTIQLPAPSEEVARSVAAALNQERAGKLLKTALLQLRSKPLYNTVASEPDAQKQFTDLRHSLSKGPITGDKLPTPRRQAPSRDSTPLRPTFFTLDEEEDEIASPTKRAAPRQPVSRGRPSQTFKGVSLSAYEGDSSSEEEEEEDDEEEYDTLQDIEEASEEG